MRAAPTPVAKVSREASDPYRAGRPKTGVAVGDHAYHHAETDWRQIAELYRGEVRREKDTLSVFAADEDMALTIDAWVEKGKHGRLLELWVKGWSFDWTRLYGDARPRRIPLPRGIGCAAN